MSKDLTAKVFGMLTVLRPLEAMSLGKKWVCKCECGNLKQVLGYNLVHGRTRSCGCFRVAQLKERNILHGASNTALYGAWCTMLGRCNNPAHYNYKNYGGRGIKVAKEFTDYSVFSAYLLTLGVRPKGYTLDRIDNSGDYAPGNLRWASPKTQGRNMRRNRLVEFAGIVMPLVEAVELAKLPYYTVHSRLRNGWSVREALHTPVGCARLANQKEKANASQ